MDFRQKLKEVNEFQGGDVSGMVEGLLFEAIREQQLQNFFPFYLNQQSCTFEDHSQI